MQQVSSHISGMCLTLSIKRSGRVPARVRVRDLDHNMAVQVQSGFANLNVAK